MNIIKHNFGSYRGFVTHLQTVTASLAGRYAAASKMDWNRVERLVFVCKGNVCRSPYANIRAISLGFQCVSFGLETSGDIPANPAAQRVAALRGIDLSAHRSARFERTRIVSSDLLVAFEPAHLEALIAAQTGAQTTLLGMWSPGLKRPYIADPYGKSDEYFQTCFGVIDRALQEMSHLCRSSKSSS